MAEAASRRMMALLASPPGTQLSVEGEGVVFFAVVAIVTGSQAHPIHRSKACGNLLTYSNHFTVHHNTRTPLSIDTNECIYSSLIYGSEVSFFLKMERYGLLRSKNGSLSPTYVEREENGFTER